MLTIWKETKKTTASFKHFKRSCSQFYHQGKVIGKEREKNGIKLARNSKDQRLLAIDAVGERKVGSGEKRLKKQNHTNALRGQIAFISPEA